MRTIGERLREERSRLGLSQEELAERAGVTRRTQFNYEAGRRKPNDAYLRAVEALGVDTDFVLSGFREGETARLSLARDLLAHQLLEALGYADLTVADVFRQVHSIFTGFEDARPAEHAAIATLARKLVLESPTLKRLHREQTAVDGDLLSAAILMVEERGKQRGATLRPAKRGLVIAAAYSRAKSSGTLDADHVDELLRLAS